MICVIPARGGSQRIPRKNIKEFHGTPIIAYSIDLALKSGLFDGVYVSTEDDEIAEVARSYGALIVRRPPELAEIGAPDVGTQAVIAHAVEVLGVEGQVCGLYATGVFATIPEMTKGLEAVQGGAHYAYAVKDGEDAGQWYWSRVKALQERWPLGYGTVRVEVRNALDINTPEDWEAAERLWEELMAPLEIQ